MTRQELALRAAEIAGEVHLNYFRKPLDEKLKNPRDIVTISDTEAEAKILELIRENFPDDSIVAEESGETSKAGEYQWIVDPLDGTANFYKGSPDFCVLIGVARGGKTVFGVTWFPVTKELYIAERGKGATLNGDPIHVSKVEKLEDAYGNTHMSSKVSARAANLGLYSKLLFEVRNIHVINACIARLLCDVATGRADFHFRHGMNIWDYAPGILLVEEAGGKSSNLAGDELSQDSSDVFVSNGRFHGDLVENHVS